MAEVITLVTCLLTTFCVLVAKLENWIWKTAETMVSQLDKLGQLKSITDQAWEEGEKMPSDFGRGGKEGMATFIKIIEREMVFQENQAFNKA